MVVVLLFDKDEHCTVACGDGFFGATLEAPVVFIATNTGECCCRAVADTLEVVALKLKAPLLVLLAFDRDGKDDAVCRDSFDVADI